MKRHACGAATFSSSPLGRGLGGGVYATVLPFADGTPPPKGEGEKLP
jgi:hypothetical protein